MKSFKQKAEEKAARLKAERLLAEAKAKDAREWEEWHLAREEEKRQSAEWQEEEIRLEEEAAENRRQQQLLREQERQQQHTPINPTFLQNNISFTWQAFAAHPKIINLPMSEKVRLFKLAQSRELARINQQGAAIGSNTIITDTYVLTFAGEGGPNDYVATTFNPDNYDGTGEGLNHGFTVSYWVKPNIVGGFRKALGRRSETDGRFEFGIKSATQVHVGIGATVKMDNNRNDGVETGHGMEVGNWYHWVVTYGGDDGVGIGGDRYVRIWINGKEIYKDGAASGTGNENGMGTANWREGNTDTVNAASNLYFGARAIFQDLDTPYNQGWDCSLSEIAIYKTEIDEDGTFANEVYNAGFGYDHRNNSNVSNLVGYWRLNEGSGTRAEDLSGNGNHGTLTTAGTGIPTWTKTSKYK